MRVLLCFASWLGATTVAQAQVLPVPDARNSDWELKVVRVLYIKTLGPRASWSETFPGIKELRPSVVLNPQDKEPVISNALTANSIRNSTSSVEGQQYYWDATRQLSYKWPVQRGKILPDSLVTVRQPATGVTFIYRKRSKSE